jgi:hypothetical protein
MFSPLFDTSTATATAAATIDTGARISGDIASVYS